jgi:hypothetical protein
MIERNRKIFVERQDGDDENDKGVFLFRSREVIGSPVST